MAKNVKPVVKEATPEVKETVAPETVQQVETNLELIPETEKVPGTDIVPEGEKSPEADKAPEATETVEKDDCMYCGGICETTEFYANDKAFCSAEHAELYADAMKGR